MTKKCQAELNDFAVKFKKTPLKDKTRNLKDDDAVNVIGVDTKKQKLYSGFYKLVI